MTRCEVIAPGVTMYLGNMTEVLASTGMIADHLISDPPYEDVFHAHVGGDGIRRNDHAGKQAPLSFGGIDALRPEAARLMVRASAGWVLAFCLAEGVQAWRDALQAADGKYDGCYFWEKPDAMPRINGQGPSRACECIVGAWAGTGYRKWNGGGRRGLFKHNANTQERKIRKISHPTEKPTSLMRELVVLFTQPGQTICDPFAGSGSTGVAAIMEGRKFVGLEQDPQWFDLACQRLTEATKQDTLFSPVAAPKLIQTGMDFPRSKRTKPTTA